MDNSIINLVVPSPKLIALLCCSKRSHQTPLPRLLHIIVIGTRFFVAHSSLLMTFAPYFSLFFATSRWQKPLFCPFAALNQYGILLDYFLVYFSIIIYSQRDPSGDFYIGVNVRAHRAAGTDAGEAGFVYRLSLLYLFLSFMFFKEKTSLTSPIVFNHLIIKSMRW